MEKRHAFPGIAPSAWEHPADRAALAAFAALPLGPELVRRLVGSTTERALRLGALAQSARASETQFASAYRLLKEACRALDVAKQPELFLRLSPEAGAFTVGVDRPFIVLTSAALELWTDEELLVVLGHELGHILSGHAVYKTLLDLLTKAASALLGSSLIGGASLAAAVAALREWDRKSELSADRAALLASQNPPAAYGALMKSAAGPRASELDLNEFFRQAAEYESAAEGADSVLKLLDILGSSHPYPVLRMTALQEWEKGGAYEAILRGEYPRRGEGGSEDPGRRFEEAAKSYRREFGDSADPLAQAAGRIMEGLEGLFSGRGPGFGGAGSGSADPGAGAGSGPGPGTWGGPWTADGQGSERPEQSGPGGEHPPSGIEDFLDEIFGARKQ